MPSILREFIDHIEVSHTDKKSRTREILIYRPIIRGAFFTLAEKP